MRGCIPSHAARRTPHLHNLTLRRLCSDAIDSLLRRLLRLLAPVMCSVGSLAGAEAARAGASHAANIFRPEVPALPLEKPTANPKP
jgi:hypothetical protein